MQYNDTSVKIDTHYSLEGIPGQLLEFELETLFENCCDEDSSVRRMSARLGAIARLAGIEVTDLWFEVVYFEGHELSTDFGFQDFQALIQFHRWAVDKYEDSYLPIIARLVEDQWANIDTSDLNSTLGELFTSFTEGDHEQLAKDLVDDGFIDEPGDGWEDYVDWEARGEDITQSYTQYDYEGVTYLFH